MEACVSWGSAGYNLAGAIPAVAQNHATSAAAGRHFQQTQQLPRSCLVHENSSEQIKVLLETINDHPTADVYNALEICTLGAVTQNVPSSAFKAALRVDGHNCNPLWPGPRTSNEGDRIRAASELQAAIRQQPDSAASHSPATLFRKEEG